MLASRAARGGSGQSGKTRAIAELALIDADLGRVTLARPEVLRLMTIPGVDATVGLPIEALPGPAPQDRVHMITPGTLASSHLW